MIKSHDVGRQGEQIAAAILKRKGFQAVASNWRYGKLGEIDLVVFHPADKLLIFVEVKTRRNHRYGEPVEAVDPRKQAQLALLAEAFIAAHPDIQAEAFRFDVISVLFPGQGRAADITHIEDAFNV